MYAILQQSGHQYRVSPGDRLVVDRLAAEVGSVVALEPVVLVAGDDGTQVGTPVVDGVRVAAVVVSHRKGAKIRVFKYKPKKHYRRTHGHRSFLTELRVEAVLAAGEPLPKPAKAAAKPAPKAKATAKAEKKAEAPVAAAAEKPARTRTRAKAAAPAEPETPAAEAEAPQAWGSGEAPEAVETEATEATAAPETETPAPRKRAPRAKKTDAAEGGDTTPES